VAAGVCIESLKMYESIRSQNLSIYFEAAGSRLMPASCLKLERVGACSCCTTTSDVVICVGALPRAAGAFACSLVVAGTSGGARLASAQLSSAGESPAPAGRIQRSGEQTSASSQQTTARAVDLHHRPTIGSSLVHSPADSPARSLDQPPAASEMEISNIEDDEVIDLTRTEERNAASPAVSHPSALARRSSANSRRKRARQQPRLEQLSHLL
jgi:hypothetical protein